MWQITKMWESICGGFKFIFSWFQIYSFCLLFANGAGPWYFSLASQEVVQPGLYRALEGHWRRKELSFLVLVARVFSLHCLVLCGFS